MFALFKKTPVRCPQVSVLVAMLGGSLAFFSLGTGSGVTLQAQTQTLVWDSDGNSINGATDGSGAWTTGGSNWLLGTTTTPWPGQATADDFIAAFGSGGTAGTVTVSGTVYAGGLRFNPVAASGYMLSGSTAVIQLRDSAVLQVDGNASLATGFLRLNTGLNADDLTIEKTGGGIAYIDLSATGTKNLTGTLTLQNTSGDIFLRVASANHFAGLDKVIVNSGSTLELDGAGTYAADFDIAGVGSSSRGAIRFDSNSNIIGTVKLMADSAIATENGGVAATVSGSIIEDGLSRRLTIRQNASNPGGSVTLSGDNKFTGGLEVQAGNVIVANSGALNSTNPNLISFANSSAAKTLTLNGYSVTTAGLSSNGGSGAITVTNGNDAGDAAATLTLDVTGSSQPSFAGVISDGLGGPLSLVKTGATRQILAGQNTYTGSTTIRQGPLELDFNNSSAPASNIINASSGLIMDGGTLIVAGKSGAAVSQTFAGLQVNDGSSIIAVQPNATTADTLVNVGAITRTGDGVISFLLPTGTQSGTNGVVTTNADGLLGSWATVNRKDWATVSGGNVVAFTGYTDVNRLGAGNTIASNGSSYVRIVEGGTTGSISLASSGVTDIHSLSMAATGGTATVNVGAGNTLRLAADGGILIAEGSNLLYIGSSNTPAAGNGSITAGGADNTAGILSVTNYYTNSESRINSTITDNGTGVVSVSHSGSARTVFSGDNTYTGGTYFNGGTVRISKDRALGATPTSVDADNLVFNGGTLNVTSMTLSANRGMVLNEQGGTLQTDTSLIYAGKITGVGSLTKTGGGYLQLQGNQNDYTGATSVLEGTLQVDGRTGTGILSVNGTNAVLAGAGTVQGTAQILRGLVSAGASQGNAIGALKFSNSLVFAPTIAEGAKALFSLQSGSGDRFDVTGDVTLNINTKFEASLESGYLLTVGDSWTLMTWTGDLTLNDFELGPDRTGAGDEGSNFDLPDLTALAGYNGEWWTISTLNNALTITIVPEPGRVLLLMLAAVPFACRRKRNR